jgi:hypothetical protein
MTEMYFMDIFKSSGSIGAVIDPHWKMTFREALGGMYGINGKESLIPIVQFNHMLRAAIEYGINTAGQFPSNYWSYSHLEGSPQDPKVRDACQKLMRLIMSPQNVINKLDANPLCHATLEMFLREVHHMPNEKIPVLLNNSDAKRQVIADMLKEYGYLIEK